jgi:hypothetical protein
MEIINKPSTPQADNTGSNYLTLLTHIVQSMRKHAGTIHINHDLAEIIAWDIARLLPVEFSIPEADQISVTEILNYAEGKRKSKAKITKLKSTRITNNLPNHETA